MVLQLITLFYPAVHPPSEDQEEGIHACISVVLFRAFAYEASTLLVGVFKLSRVVHKEAAKHTVGMIASSRGPEAKASQ